MPGPVSDSYDPEFGTSNNAGIVRSALDQVLGRVSEALGPEKKGIVGVAIGTREVIEDVAAGPSVTFHERELRLIRFGLERAKESI